MSEAAIQLSQKTNLTKEVFMVLQKMLTSPKQIVRQLTCSAPSSMDGYGVQLLFLSAYSSLG